MAQVQLPAYPSFQIVDDPSVASKWEDWLDGFEAMTTAMKVEKKDRKAMLIHYAGAEVRKLLKKLPEASEGDTYTKAITALNSYFAPFEKCFSSLNSRPISIPFDLFGRAS
jgi:hypothetical protein